MRNKIHKHIVWFVSVRWRLCEILSGFSCVVCLVRLRAGSCTLERTPVWFSLPQRSVRSTCPVWTVFWRGTRTVPGTRALPPASIFSSMMLIQGEKWELTFTLAIQIKSNQITFIVTSSQHMCLDEWNSWERSWATILLSVHLLLLNHVLYTHNSLKYR